MIDGGGELYSAAINQATQVVTLGQTTWVATPDGIKKISPGKPPKLYLENEGLPGRDVLVLDAHDAGVAAVVQTSPRSAALCIYNASSDRWRTLATIPLPDPDRMGLSQMGFGSPRITPVLLLAQSTTHLYFCVNVARPHGSAFYTIERQSGQLQDVALGLEPPGLPSGFLLPLQEMPMALSVDAQGQVRMLTSLGRLARLNWRDKPPTLEYAKKDTSATTPRVISAQPTRGAGFWAIQQVKEGGLNRATDQWELPIYELVLRDAQGEIRQQTRLPDFQHDATTQGQVSNVPSIPYLTQSNDQQSLDVICPSRASHSRSGRDGYRGEAWRYLPKDDSWKSIPLPQTSTGQRAWDLPDVSPQVEPQKRFDPPPVPKLAWRITENNELLSSETAEKFPLPAALEGKRVFVQATDAQAVWGEGWPRDNEPRRKISYFYFDVARKTFTFFELPPALQQRAVEFIVKNGEVLGTDRAVVYQLDRATGTWTLLKVQGREQRAYGSAAHFLLIDAPATNTILLSETNSQNGQTALFTLARDTFVPVLGSGAASAYCLAGKQLWLATETGLHQLVWTATQGFQETKHIPLPWFSMQRLKINTNGELWGFTEREQAFRIPNISPPKKASL